MGTNYYWESEPCGCCGHSSQRLHVCKSLVMFRGHFRKPDWDDDRSTPDVQLPSWVEWRRFLLNTPGRIVDEYGDVHDRHRFIERVEATGRDARRRQCDWVRFNSPSGQVVDVPASGLDWLDGDGFSFYGDEFS